MTGNSRRWVPTAIVVLAVAALGVAARRAGGLDAGAADGLAKDLRPVGALLAVLVLVIAAVSFAKHRDDGFGALHRAGTATALLLVAAAVLTPIGLLTLGRQSPSKPARPAHIEDDSTTTPTRTMPPGVFRNGIQGKDSGVADFVVNVVMYLIAAAALALLGYGLYRLLRRRWFTRLRLPVLEFGELPDADLEQLAEAVAAGSEALAYQGEAREAVIACYAAMEEVLGAAGSGRREADTPEDFLQRVTGTRLIPAEPARRLTELFREARFSRHPIAEAQRGEARDALAAIAEHLRARTAEAQARVDADVKIPARYEVSWEGEFESAR
ncbi:MAG: DUF4129 domain-containing protein, partial [Catenulispora sp.]|nr:DUF4129 domain-containing protein [Catenulispora sp.]